MNNLNISHISLIPQHTDFELSAACLSVFLELPVWHNIANGIKPGSNSKKTDKHAADCSKVVCWGLK